MRLKSILTTTLIVLVVSTMSFAQNVEYKTGDIELDANLKSIDVDAQVDFGVFKADMGVSYNISEKKIDELHVGAKMSAGEIYMALEICKETKKPIDEVVKVYKVNKAKGWGVIAKELGIKPGSKEFHALKGNVKGKASKGNGKNKDKKENQGKGKKK